MPHSMVQLGAMNRSLVGGMYADDLKTLSGLQRIIDVVRQHSRKWGWTLNVKKSVVMVFGTQAARAPHADHQFFWAAAELPRVAKTKYLGVHFTEDVTWDLHVAEAAKKGQAVFYMWARLLASSRLSVDLKIQQIIDARLRPVMEYGMEVWAPPDRALDSTMLAPLDKIVTKACKLACGIRSTPTETATTRQRTVKQPVIEADTGMLPNGYRVDIAHARLSARVKENDGRATTMRSGDKWRPEFEATPPASRAPDYMGAAVRLSMQTEDAWLQRVRYAENVVTVAADANSAGDEDQNRERRSDNEQIRDAIAQDRARSRVQASTARPTPPGSTRSGRLVRETQGTGSHQNPVDEVLLRTTRAPYLCATDGVTLPIMTLRSGHLPHDYSDNAQAVYNTVVCDTCNSLLVPTDVRVSPEEQRWRHIQHILLGCTGLHLRQTCARSAVPILGDLKADLLQCASGNNQTIDAISSALPDTAGPACDEATRKSIMDLLQDPVQALEGPRAMLLEAAALVAAYITLHGAHSAAMHADTVRMRGMRLPHWSRMWAFA